MPEQQDNNQQINQAVGGLNLDAILTQLPKGTLTYCLNGNIENFDGNAISIGNDASNTLCVTFPEGYKVVGVRNITEISRVLYWLLNPTTGDGQIGYSDNDACTYTTLVSDEGNDCKFNFSIEHPILKSVVKTTNCSTQVYWTDGFNPRRYIDFDNLPWKEVINPDNDFKPTPLIGQLDCNKLLVQPNFKVPTITPTEVAIGGQLVEGTYQFAIQYANSLGEGYTSFYSVTNPLGIFEQKVGEVYNLPTSKSIKVKIDNIDTSELYTFFNLAVIKTVNNNPSVELIDTFAISDSQFTYNYTGESKSSIRLTIADIFEKFPYYDLAQDIFEVDNVIGWDQLQANERLNYQDIWANAHLQWVSYQIPYNQFEAYNNGINTEAYRGYFRDEVYAFEGVFILKNGKQTDSFPIVGRIATPFDREIVHNADADQISLNNCEEPTPKQRWQVYNTASDSGFTTEFLTNTEGDDCYVGPYKYGEFAYWESTEKYPNNPTVFGNLSGQNIRHFKFPDIAVSPIHDNAQGDLRSYQHHIYPLGVRIDLNSLYNAIQASTLTQDQKDQIQGFKIVRGNRKTHESIIAKGILNNVGHTDYYDELGTNPKTYYYPNYPYNDVRPDPYYSNIFLQRAGIDYLNNPTIPMGYNPQYSINGFVEERSTRFAFHSPDTHFYQPSISNNGEYLKIESIEYGNSYGHFIKVEKNAEYKFLTRNTIYAAAGLGIASGLLIGAGTYGWPEFTMAPIAPTFNSATELFENLAPYTNFGYTYNSTGWYGNSYLVPNDGNKIRNIYFNKYIIDGKNSIEDGNQLNNFRRESAIYIDTLDSLPYPHDYNTLVVPIDDSRYNLASTTDPDKTPGKIRETNISSYYGAIKKYVPDQWGRISNYEVIDTGFYAPLYNKDGSRKSKVPDVFGGDIFINRFAFKTKQSIFTNTTVGGINGADINYNELGTLNYPMFWMSTKPANFDIDIKAQVDALAGQLFNGGLLSIIANIVTGAAVGSVIAMALVRRLFEEIYNKIGIKNVNFDNGKTEGLTEQGLFYLYVYGIPYFFVESEENVDYRQATNDKEGNFYPNVAGEIPDDWLQEINVPIIQDNIYNYNQTYSKQNKENYFSHLRPDYDSEKRCLVEFPNRAIWSDKSSQEETKNNWLVYRPSNYYDFPKSYGDLVSIDKIVHNQLLTRFTNKSQIYNALTTIDVKNSLSAYTGTGDLFSSAPPMDISNTDIGYAGSQHKFLLRTEFGQVFVDAKRGQIIVLNGQNIKDIADQGLDKWFSANLPFQILSQFPDIDIDNNFNGIGLHGTYDQYYQRLFITKLDYLPLVDTVFYQNGHFYDSAKPIEEGGRINYEEAYLSDPEYFCNKSWTLSYCFKTGSWTSFHSFQPNYYVAHPNYFQTGVDSGLWNHNQVFDSFCNYYGTQYPYILEYPFVYKIQDEILQNIKDYSKARVYSDYVTFYEPEEILYFDDIVVYNDQQCTGIRNLIPKPANNLAAYGTYPKYNADSIDIMLVKSDNFYNVNTIWDSVIDKSVPIFYTTCALNVEDKTLNQSNINYGQKDFKKAQIRAKDAKIRLSLRFKSFFKLISQFVITDNRPSYK